MNAEGERIIFSAATPANATVVQASSRTKKEKKELRTGSLARKRRTTCFLAVFENKEKAVLTYDRVDCSYDA